MNDLPLRISSLPEPQLSADDTSVNSSTNFEGTISVSNPLLSLMIEWLAVNKLLLTLDKTNIMEFVTNSWSHCTLRIGYKEKCIDKYEQSGTGTSFRSEFFAVSIIPPMLHVRSLVCHRPYMILATDSVVK
jgi:hypothetical protein